MERERQNIEFVKEEFHENNYDISLHDPAENQETFRIVEKNNPKFLPFVPFRLIALTALLF